MFLKFNIPRNPSLEAIIRHLIQPHVMTYINSHPEMFYKKMSLKVSQNSQEISCAEVSFSCNLIKTRLWTWWFSMNFAKLLWRQSRKGKCVQMFPKKVYIFWVYLNQVIKRTFYYKCCCYFMIRLKMKNIITQILFIGNLIKFIWIIVLALQVWQKVFALGLDLTYHKCPRFLFQFLGSRVLGPM